MLSAASGTADRIPGGPLFNRARHLHCGQPSHPYFARRVPEPDPSSSGAGSPPFGDDGCVRIVSKPLPRRGGGDCAAHAAALECPNLDLAHALPRYTVDIATDPQASGFTSEPPPLQDVPLAVVEHLHTFGKQIATSFKLVRLEAPGLLIRAVGDQHVLPFGLTVGATARTATGPSRRADGSFRSRPRFIALAL